MVESDVDFGESKQFRCDIPGCNSSFTKNRKLINHLRRHRGERPYICDYESCGKSYTNSSHLLRHKKSHLEENKTKVECPVRGCGLHVSHTSLKRHLDRMHNSKRKFPFTCDICQEGFLRKHQLKMHIYKHTGISPYECETCGERFITIKGKNRHKRTHTVYECSCELKFERWSSYRSHQLKCETNNFKCGTCGKFFKRNYLLKEHKKLHLSSSERETFTCGYELCGRTYSHKRNLEYHIKVFHMKLKRAKIFCSFPGCKSSFYQKQKLRIHYQKFHTDNKEKTKMPRKERCDKGLPKTNFISQLTGLPVPTDVNRQLVKSNLLEDEQLKEIEESSNSPSTSKVEVIGVGTENSDYVDMQFVVLEYKNDREELAEHSQRESSPVTAE